MKHIKSIISTAIISAAAAGMCPVNAATPEYNFAGADHQSFNAHYMGNIEAGNMFPWESFMNNSAGIATLTTTHGVVVRPWLYTGFGTGFWLLYAHEGIAAGLPVFVDARLTYPNRRWRPFVDLKAGTFIGGETLTHFLIMPSVGLKFAIKDTFGIYLSIGTMGHFSSQFDSKISEGLSLKLGFDF